jgi:hypothetical protein
LPYDRKNIDIELFYHKGKKVAIAGKRDDGYDYVTTGTIDKIKKLHLDVNDFLQKKVKYKANINEIDEKEIVIEDDEQNLVVDSNSEVINIKEVSNLIYSYFSKNIPIVIRTKVAEMQCPFKDMHSKGKKQQAGILKKNGVYYGHCFGQVCKEE